MISLEKLTKTRFLKLDLNSQNRYLFISDIHGNLSLLKKALTEVSFNKNDYLFLIGDLVEKGKENLKILDYLMDLAQNYHIYFLRGNCDQVFNFLIPPVDKEKLLYFANIKGNSVINEMASLLNIALDESIDADEVGKSFYESFKKYYDFVDSFYDVILLDEKYLLVHGGLDDLKAMPLYNDSLLKNDFYYFKAKYSPYIRIVGHNPTCNLCREPASNKPIIDLDKNVIDIDGGNNVSLSGELNVLEIKSNKISYKTFNEYELITSTKKVINDNAKAFHTSSYLDNLKFKNEILGDYYIVYKDGEKAYSHKKDVSFKNGKIFSYDATSNFINLNKGDTYYLAYYASPFSLVIKDSEVGLLRNEVIADDLCSRRKI